MHIHSLVLSIVLFLSSLGSASFSLSHRLIGSSYYPSDCITYPPPQSHCFTHDRKSKQFLSRINILVFLVIFTTKCKPYKTICS
ncbi:hypothetical protein AAZV13_02G240100 [Glycine max]